MARQIELPKNIKKWLFIESLIDVFVAFLYRIVASLRDILRAINPFQYIAKFIAYLINKSVRAYTQFYPPNKGEKKSQHLKYLWPIGLALMAGNLVFDLFYNYQYVFRILNGAFAWLTQPMVAVVASMYMIFNSLSSLYSNTLSWYGISYGKLNLSRYESLISLFIILTSLSEATIASLFFMLTTQMNFLTGIPFCIILYFVPPFMQNYVDMTVRTNLISQQKENELSKNTWVLFIALYVTSAQVAGTCFQIAGIMKMLNLNLSWLAPATLSSIGVGLVAFFAIQAIISSSISWGQFIWGVDFLDDTPNPLLGDELRSSNPHMIGETDKNNHVISKVKNIGAKSGDFQNNY